MGAANGLQTLMSDTVNGKKKENVLSDTLTSAALGALTGGSVKYLGETLPQAGTIAYQQLLESGGKTAAAAPFVSQLAKTLNPDAAKEISKFKLGSVGEEGYNKI